MHAAQFPDLASRLAVCSWSLQPRGIDDLLRQLDQVHLRRVQLALSPILHEPESWTRAVERLRNEGVTIVSAMMQTRGEDYTSLESIARTGGVRRDETWPENERHAAAVAEFAAANDIRLVSFHAGFLPESIEDPERKVLLGRLGAVADRFASQGVAIALETGQESATTLIRALDDLGRENVGVNFDPANMILYDRGDPVEAIQLLRPWVWQVHLKDALHAAKPGTWGREVPLGDGAVNWPAFLGVVRTLDLPIDLVIEREAGTHRVRDIRRAAALIRTLESS